mgnify:CR=1 FL=1
MVYLVTFLEGLITFISPCLLPMLPIYLSYFAGGQPDASRGRVLKNALGFVLGFTLLFVAMGAFAGSIGALLTRHQQAVNIISWPDRHFLRPQLSGRVPPVPVPGL